jgi:hypothetical protein
MNFAGWFGIPATISICTLSSVFLTLAILTLASRRRDHSHGCLGCQRTIHRYRWILGRSG